MRGIRSTRTLSLLEYQTTPDVPLTLDERDTLQRLSPSLTVTPSAGAYDRYHLTPGSWVGAISLGDLAVEIRPKLPIANLLFLIAYALDPCAWQDVPFDHAAGSLTEAVVPAFVHLIGRATRRGLLHRYRAEEAPLPAVRGRISFADHVRRLGVAPPIDVCFDDHTADVEENRLLKTALQRLRRLPLRSDSVAALIRRALRLFEEVQSVEYDSRRLPEIDVTRLNAHYGPALRLARLILQGIAFDLGHGAVTGTAFLVDMNQVFEDFVVAALRESLGLEERTFPQGLRWRPTTDRSPTLRRRLPLDQASALHLEPDLSWWDGERCVFVGDVKYKRTGATGGEHPDLYQLLAYAVAAGLPGGLLVYAAGEDTPISHRIRRAGKTLHITALDLSGSPSEILSEIDDVAAQICQLRTAAARLSSRAAHLSSSAAHLSSPAAHLSSRSLPMSSRAERGIGFPDRERLSGRWS